MFMSSSEFDQSSNSSVRETEEDGLVERKDQGMKIQKK